MRRVLVVDDEPITRLNLKLMLADAGYEIIGEAADGFDAVEICRAKQVDLVLMDIQMGLFDGLSAAETICSEDLAGCVVMLTAFADEALVNRANQIGISGYAVKPVDQRTLLPTLEVALAQSARLRDMRRQAEQSQADLEERKVIDTAKFALAEQAQISEKEAYRQLQKAAMDKRISLYQAAQAVLGQNTEKETVNAAKQILIRRERLSEKAAFKKLQQLAEEDGLPLIKMSQLIISSDKGEV